MAVENSNNNNSIKGKTKLTLPYHERTSKSSSSSKTSYWGLSHLKEYTDLALSLLPEETANSLAKLKFKLPQKVRDKHGSTNNAISGDNSGLTVNGSRSAKLDIPNIPELAMCRVYGTSEFPSIMTVDEASTSTANTTSNENVNLAMLSTHSLPNVPPRATRPRHNTFSSLSTVSSSCGYVDVAQRVPTNEDIINNTNWAATPNSPSLFSSYDKHSIKDAGVAFLKDPEFQMNLDPLMTLPTEIVHRMLSYLDIHTLLTCSLVSQAWKATIDQNSVWRNEFRSKKHWDTVDNVPLDLSWKELYKTRHELEKRWRKGIVKATTLMGHSDRVYCVSFDKDKIITGSSDRTINIWDYNTGTLMRTLGRVDDVTQPSQPPQPRLSQPQELGPANDLHIDINGPRRNSDTPSVSENRVLPLKSKNVYHKGSVLCVAFDDKVMITGSSDCTCIVWELSRMRPIKQFYRHKSGVLEVSMSNDYIATCSKDGTITVWENKHPKYCKIATLLGHRGPVNSVQIKGEFIVSAGGDSLVKLWSIPDKSCVRDFRGHTRGLACVSFSEDGTKIISGGNDNTIRIWDSANGECLHILTGHKSLVRSLCIQSNRIISGSYDQTIKIWDLDTGLLLADLDGFHGSWIFSVKSDCRRIVSTSMGIKPVILDFSDGLNPDYLKYLRA